MLPTDSIAHRINIVRGQCVMLDSDLAALYEVPTKRFNEAIKRNIRRFPSDFMFQLAAQEWETLSASLRSRNATLNSAIETNATDTSRRGKHRKYLPYVFTEHGAIMAATILNSERAVEVSVHVVRAFVQLRAAAHANEHFSRELAALEKRIGEKLKTHDQAIVSILETLRRLMHTPETEPEKRPIGFEHPEEKTKKGPLSRATKRRQPESKLASPIGSC